MRDDEDAATVIAILTALAALTEASSGADEAPGHRSVWADPAHRLGVRSPSASGWWASGLPS